MGLGNNMQTTEATEAAVIPDVIIERNAVLEGNADKDFEAIMGCFENLDDNVTRVVVKLSAKDNSAFPEVFIQEAQLRERIQKHMLDTGMIWAMGKDITEGHFHIRITRAGLEKQVLRADYIGEYPFNRIGMAELAGVFKERPSNG